MEGVTLYFLILSILFFIIAVVASLCWLRVQEELNNLRAEVDHAERDEILRADILKECNRRIVEHTFSCISAHEDDFHE